MTYTTENTSDHKQIKNTHEQLAEKHGEENVYVAPGKNSGIITIVSDGIGTHLQGNDKVEVDYADYHTGTKYPGKPVTKRYTSVNFLEHMKLVGFPDEPKLQFKTDEVQMGWDPGKEYVLGGKNSPYTTSDRNEARTFAILTSLEEINADPDEYDFNLDREYIWLTEFFEGNEFDPTPFFESPYPEENPTQ